MQPGTPYHRYTLWVDGILRNSQQVRLIVSQRTDNTLAVIDWLGNPVSRLGGPGSALGQFSSPQGLFRSFRKYRLRGFLH